VSPALDLAILARDLETSADFVAKIEQAIRLIATTRVELVPFGRLPPIEYKTKLVDFSNASGEG
jgi:hypothetical protein